MEESKGDASLTVTIPFLVNDGDGDKGSGGIRAVFDMRAGCLSRLQLLEADGGGGGSVAAVDLLDRVEDGAREDGKEEEVSERHDMLVGTKVGQAQSLLRLLSAGEKTAGFVLEEERSPFALQCPIMRRSAHYVSVLKYSPGPSSRPWHACLSPLWFLHHPTVLPSLPGTPVPQGADGQRPRRVRWTVGRDGTFGSRPGTFRFALGMGAACGGWGYRGDDGVHAEAAHP